MKTKYAPAEREEKEKVILQKEKIENSEFLTRVMTGTPFLFFILNDKRQVVFSNNTLMKFLGYERLEDMAGFRPGELFRCIHSEKEEGGCGTSESCRYCGAINAVLESKKMEELVIKDSVINISMNGNDVPMNFEVSSKPFIWMDEQFFVITMQDIAEKVRKEQLERTFFHDIINKAGNVGMVLDFLQKKDMDDSDRNMIEAVKKGFSELLEDINYQKLLKNAEKGELEPQNSTLEIAIIAKGVIDEYDSFSKSWEVILELDSSSGEISITTDKVLLKRVLGNLMKNAIEASKPGDIVTLDYCVKDSELILTVRNPAVIPIHIQAQIFNRSFTTKGTGRGIGTYSIKLFTEQYLGGKVDFTSTEKDGTAFHIYLPLKA